MSETKHTMHAVGFVLNRSARKQKLELLVDPSDREFLSRATADKDRIAVTITPENMAPIRLSGIPLGLRLRLRDVALENDSQLPLLEWLINDDGAAASRIEIAHDPKQDDLPFDDGGGETACDGSTEPVQSNPDDEAIDFVPRGIKNASVTLRYVDADDGKELVCYSWQVGNYVYQDRMPNVTSRNCREQSFELVRQHILKSMSDYEPSGSADAQRSAKARISDLQSQADQWLQGLIDAAEAEKSSGGTEAIET